MKAVRGFTLIELLVALTVVAVVATSVYLRSGETIAQLHSLERRTLALMVAQNELQRTRLRHRLDGATPATGGTRRRVTFAGFEWAVSVTTRSTSHPLLKRLQFDVFAIEGQGEGGRYASVTAFIGQH